MYINLSSIVCSLKFLTFIPLGRINHICEFEILCIKLQLLIYEVYKFKYKTFSEFILKGVAKFSRSHHFLFFNNFLYKNFTLNYWWKIMIFASAIIYIPIHSIQIFGYNTGEINVSTLKLKFLVLNEITLGFYILNKSKHSYDKVYVIYFLLLSLEFHTITKLLAPADSLDFATAYPLLKYV